MVLGAIYLVVDKVVCIFLELIVLSKNDLDQIKKVVKIETGHLPTKDEFYEAMDEMMGEIKSIREEIAGMHSSYENHEERISALEEVVTPPKAS